MVAAIPSQAPADTAGEGVETWRLRPTGAPHGQGKVQTTNRKGGESHSGTKIRRDVSPVRVRVPPPAIPSISWGFQTKPLIASPQRQQGRSLAGAAGWHGPDMAHPKPAGSLLAVCGFWMRQRECCRVDVASWHELTGLAEKILRKSRKITESTLLITPLARVVSKL